MVNPAFLLKTQAFSVAQRLPDEDDICIRPDRR
jgi:hypothetical protein